MFKGTEARLPKEITDFCSDMDKNPNHYFKFYHLYMPT